MISEDICYLLEWLPVVNGENEQHGVRVSKTDLDRIVDKEIDVIYIYD